MEAELRRRVRQELEEARGERSEGDGQLDDAALSAVIARAITAAMQWHLEAPEHTRNATLSSRTWRPAGGPRGGRNAEDDDRPPRDFPRGARDYDRPRQPREYPRGPRDYDDRPRDYDREHDRDRDRDFDRPTREYDRDRRDFDRPPPRDYDRGPRQFDPDRPRPPRQGGRPPGPRGGNYKRGGSSKGGGFRSRKPR